MNSIGCSQAIRSTGRLNCHWGSMPLQSVNDLGKRFISGVSGPNISITYDLQCCLAQLFLHWKDLRFPGLRGNHIIFFWYSGCSLSEKGIRAALDKQQVRKSERDPFPQTMRACPLQEATVIKKTLKCCGHPEISNH